MNYASFIYKMIFLNNSLKHAKKKIMSIHKEKIDREKIMIIRLKFVNIFSRGVTQNNKY